MNTKFKHLQLCSEILRKENPTIRVAKTTDVFKDCTPLERITMFRSSLVKNLQTSKSKQP